MKYHTYFFSWCEPLENGSFAFGSETFRTQSTGELLIMDAKNLIYDDHPNAVIVSISELGEVIE